MFFLFLVAKESLLARIKAIQDVLIEPEKKPSRDEKVRQKQNILSLNAFLSLYFFSLHFYVVTNFFSVIHAGVASW